MRSKPVGVVPAAHESSVGASAPEANALAQAEAEALAAIDASWLDEVQRTDVLKPEHLRRRLASPSQDVDWDEDATCHYTRDDAGILSTGAANRNAAAQHSTSDGQAWEEEQITTHFSRLLEPEAPERPAIFELSSLLEPDEPVTKSRLWSEPARVPRATRSRSTAQPPPPPSFGTQRISAASRLPVAGSGYSSLAPELRGGVEASARTSLRPGRSPWLWSVAAALPICAALGAYALWANPQWSMFELAHGPKLAHVALSPLSKVSPPNTEPAVVEPVKVEPAQIEAPPTAATPSVAIPPDPAAEDPVVGVPGTMSAELASGRRSRSHERTLRAVTPARRITPLVEPAMAERVGSGVEVASSTGILQINSRPWARVLVDDGFVGNTPQRALKLAAGRHTVRLVNEAFSMSKQIVVTVEAGRTLRRVETLDDDAAPSASR